MVALSGSVSNHWSRKSAALMVISWMKTCCCSRAAGWPKARSRPARGRKPRGSRPVGSAGTIAQDGLDEARHLDHQQAVFLVRLGVGGDQRRSSRIVWRVVVGAPQVVACAERRERAVEGQDLQAVAGQVELADDLRPQQADTT